MMMINDSDIDIDSKQKLTYDNVHNNNNIALLQ